MLFINVKTCEKALQFGPTKCKSMLVGKNTKNVINSKLMVDKWTENYQYVNSTQDLVFPSVSPPLESVQFLFVSPPYLWVVVEEGGHG